MSVAAAQPQHDSITLAARELRQTHRLSTRRPRAVEAWADLGHMLRWLDRVQTVCMEPEPASTKAAEWLLDNRYQVDRAIRQIREDLPPQFYRRLPSLESPGQERLPRAYCLAHALLDATHLQPSLASAVQFVEVYEEVAPLTIGELWAFPTLLRLACLEILVAATEKIFPKVPAPFEEIQLATALHTLEPEECVARALAGLGVIASIVWKDFFERTSVVDATLRGEPGNVYASMDFDTRDRYRKAVEELADGAGCSEVDVAERALAQARAESDDARRSHVGYWLVDAGRRAMEAELGYRISRRAAAGRWLRDHACACYAGALISIGLAALAVPVSYAWMHEGARWLDVAVVVLSVVPASILSVTLVHWFITMAIPPRVLPKLDFEGGIAADCRALVVVPVIVADPKEVHELIERLEMHWLSNPDPLLRFALLSDLADADAERMPTDAAVEQALVDGIRLLNRRHAATGEGRFHLLHRGRLYNASESCWMGWERKRGKLEQLNRVLLGAQPSDFPLREGDDGALEGIRFVVTVDADTTLPPGSVYRLIGTLAHPLNRPQFDADGDRLCAGHTVVQPRVEISPESGMRSLFSRLYAGDTAIDIYSRAVSNVYQDLFGSGVYVGKGAYDVAAFQRSLEGRVPENALLSHDLFEGAHGRVALASDIVLYDDFPPGYVAYVHRWHRWIRGDWQLLPWLAQRVPASGAARRANPLSVLDRWRILDNLRRSLIPAALIAFAVTGWLTLPGSPWVWTLLTVAAPGAYLFTDLVTGLAQGRRRGTVRGMARLLRNHAGRWLLAIVFLLHDALVSLDAIARTLWRLFVSRRRLLMWTSAAHVAARLRKRDVRIEAWREMWPSATLAAASAAGLVLVNPMALSAAGPLLLLWLVAPEVAARIGRPRRALVQRLDAAQRSFLRRVARRTWLYFESFAGPDDNWLAPDNVQEDPHEDVAHRTSPTNIGMQFLSSLTAWDLGYVGTEEFAVRIENGLDTLARLERYRGHVLNWYDTRTLAPLEPRYVSTVDSGNLAVCLVTLKEGCLEVANAPMLAASRWDGLADTLDLLVEALDEGSGTTARELEHQIEALQQRIAWLRGRPGNWQDGLAQISAHTWPTLEATIARVLADPDAGALATLREIHVWLERVTHHLTRMQSVFEILFPWLSLLRTRPQACADVADEIVELLAPTLTLAQAQERGALAADLLRRRRTNVQGDDTAASWLAALETAVEQGVQAQRRVRERLLDTAARASAMAFAMDFTLLYDNDNRLFSIGYNVSSDRIDPHHYDLLASEARLASYFAIAKRDVPAEHWYFLRRPLSRVSGELSLLSWNGSMFEFLMPALLLRSGAGRLLDQSEHSAVDIQRRYGDRLEVPWGVSESAFASRDVEQHYQYRAFGVPGLGLRRGLARDVVIAPYATALALAVRPIAAVRNLRRLARLGLLQLYGFFEAADFTRERTTTGRAFALVHSYMAHHQGMTLSAIGNALNDDALVRRFSADKRMRAADLLMQERIPWEVAPEEVAREAPSAPRPRRETVAALHPWRPRAEATFPQVNMLGNGRLASWVSESGGGALWWHGHALTRWRSDAARDDLGLWVYVRDREAGSLWSVGREPTGVRSQDAHVIFHGHMAEFHRRDNGIAIAMEVAVAPGDDLEIRRITVVNESERVRTLELTSYAEVALAVPGDDERHPAFSKLFVAGEHLPALDALLFTRRPRDPEDQAPALLHRIVCEHLETFDSRFDTDRAAFLGRNGSARQPRGVLEGLTQSSGWTLDPIMALQLRLELRPRERQQFAFVTMAAPSRASVLELAERYATLPALDWVMNDAAWEAARDAQRFQLEPARLPQLQALASLVLYPQRTMRAAGATLAANRLGQPHLWALGISGDLPILILRVGDPRDTELMRLLMRAHRLWERALFHVDIVIVRTGLSGYEEPLRERLLALLHETGDDEVLGRNGGVHLVFADNITTEVLRLLESVAWVILDESRGTLEAQLARAFAPRPPVPRFEPALSAESRERTAPLPRPEDLLFDNGIGGFSTDGKEYVIYLAPGEHTPAPWCNVLANDEFGCLVTEAGGGFTWSLNSGENRLTPWTNDAVADPPGEVLYLRNEETAEIWTPTPAPSGGDAAFEIRHGAGYSRWRSRSRGFEQELTIFVAADDPVKVVRLVLRNLQPRPRRVTATYYAQWLLGSLRSRDGRHVVATYDAASHALLARNAWNPAFAERVAFLTSDRAPHSVSTNCTAFLGGGGDLAHPAALLQWDLGGDVEPGAGACAALQIHLDIAADATEEALFVLGQEADLPKAKRLLERWREPGHAADALAAVRSRWDAHLGSVQVQTPDPAFDLMLNRWLLYQTLASRIMARAGFYQAGGAIGFRDQLQDVLALLHTEPARARAHILRCAARQFEEGDVLHWWHPPEGRGVRTRCSDDLLWLPYVTSRYVETTGDVTILTEDVPFLHAAPLTAEEGDRYARFDAGSERGTLFEHCRRALEHGITSGAHGLPRMGAGDWNDGMNRVGRRGHGESVWLGWFAIAVIEGFADMAGRLGRDDAARIWAPRVEELRAAMDASAWDGAWYLRAFDDEAQPWGSSACDECRIDSIAQSWAVLSASGQAPSERARQALASAARELVRDDERLILLLWPPFDRTRRDPGYIKAYPPGIRENGGQYTHAAAWYGFALADLGDGDGAFHAFDLINPVRRTAAADDAQRYRSEPYVLAADIASVAPHVGRGGWTWYTGSASWTWRLGLEGILGLRRRDGEISIDPCLPKTWGAARARLQGPAGTLVIEIADPEHLGRGFIEMTVDGAPFTGDSVAFPGDGKVREVQVRLVRAARARRDAS